MQTAKYEINFSNPIPEESEMDAVGVHETTGTLTLLDSLDPRESRELSSELKDHLETGCRFWEFNLDKIENCDVSTLGVFLGVHALLRRRAGGLKVKVRPHSQVQKLLKLCKLDQVLSVSAS